MTYPKPYSLSAFFHHYPVRLSLAVTVMLLSLSACQSTPTTDRAPTTQSSLTATAPDWTLQPPLDSQTTLYGLGEATTREQAIQNALADLTAKLGVQVNASFNSQLTVKNRGFEWIQQDAQKTVSTQNQTITLSHYDIAQSYAPLPTRFFILVSVNKQRLAQDSIDLLEKYIQRSPWQQAGWSSLGEIDRYVQLERALAQLPEFNRHLALLKTLSPQQNTQPYLAYSQNIEQKFIAAQDALHFEVISKNELSKPYMQGIQQRLAQAQFLKTTQNNVAAIHVSTNQETTTAYGFTIVRVTVNLTTHENGQLKSSQTFQVKGQGSDDFQAQQQAQLRFTNLIKGKTILEILGLSSLPVAAE